MLFLLYLKRIAIPLTYAILASLMVIQGGLIELAITYCCASYFASYLLSQWILKKIAPQLAQKYKNLIAKILSTIVSISSWVLLNPHLFLFFHALPCTVSTSIMMITMFIIGFELWIHVPHLHLGDHYSLTKLILHPKTSIQRFARMLRPGIEGLELSTAETATLRRKQEAALAQLPDNAIIDDIGLYEQYLQEEGRKQQSESWSIRLDALDMTRTEANRLASLYAATLTPTQAAAYRHYRELCMQLSPPYAECLISRESIHDQPGDAFVIVEKRLNNGHCAPHKTFFWHNALGFRRLFTIDDDQGNNLEPCVPTDRDSFIAPRDENGRPGNYVYHKYTTVKNHALSLQLCEAIETLNEQLQLSTSRDASTAQASAYLNSIPPNKGSISRQSIYTDIQRPTDISRSPIDPSISPGGSV